MSVINTNLDQHLSTKVNTFRYPVGGGLGGSQRIFLKKSNEMKAFPLR